MSKQIVIRTTIFFAVFILAAIAYFIINRSQDRISQLAPGSGTVNTPLSSVQGKQSAQTKTPSNTGKAPIPLVVQTEMPAAVLYASDPTGPTPTVSRVPFGQDNGIRAIRADYKDMSASRDQVKPLEQSIREAGFNLVSLGAGRAEWTYFKWVDHTIDWSSDIKTTGIDFLADDSARFGAWAHVDAAVDVLSPLYIQNNPMAAAVSAEGIPSKVLISTTQMVDGPYGRQLLAMIEAIAANYPVDSISINELSYHFDGYGADDKASFLAYSKEKDWPRLATGVINIDNPQINAWRSYELSRFLTQARNIAHRYGKEFYVNTTINFEGSSSSNQAEITMLSAMLNDADRVILWNDINLARFNPETFTSMVTSLAPIKQKSLTIVLGLWGFSDNQAINPEQLQAAMLAVQSNGLNSLWITPASLMDPGLWQTVSKNWKP